MFGAFYFGQAYFAGVPQYDATPVTPVVPVVSVTVMGSGGGPAEEQKRWMRIARDEEDVELIVGLWLNLM
jgi:hypothetical protein